MHYGKINCYDVANGVGVRVSLFVSGCRHHCKGCFNSETWDFNYGSLYTKAEEYKIISALKPDYITGFSILGGEPFEPENQRELLPLLRRIHNELSNKTIWCYTGYLFDKDLQEGGKVYTAETKELLSLIDVLVDGEFIEEEKDLSLVFRGSRNQRVIKLENGKMTELLYK